MSDWRSAGCSSALPLGAEHHRCVDSATIGYSSRTDYGNTIADCINHLRNQREGSDRRVLAAAVVTLRDDQVDTRFHYLQGVLALSDPRHDLGALGMKAFNPRIGIAKACCIDRPFFFADYFHLRFNEPPPQRQPASLAT